MATNLIKITWQTVLLWLVFRLGGYLVGVLHLSLPGNVAGMLLMFALLASGLVKPALIEAASGFLLKHFAFFFIPISVGLMSFGPLVRQSGLALLAILLVSALAGAAVTGVSVQMLQRRREP
ncbi:CidA/LrgA family protein [Geomonas nitrogeniifigens]|uniref:CidA/LrgA family protein n=1 Tax=Geomonas diazotrophica TaxID=2843197 RepID=A0ABX8JM41_9BACT|nr:CidA/LrgA family protein [Geomonas nitrogeniifigens]QWV98744.1 CidA/LrgA family protein [Geomonas nitrogeniifigens]QXE87901.1 CidA/LrgA family protein [Geomonas nitrogeniifigens]